VTHAPVRLLLVDDHEVLRLGLATLFRRVDHFEVVAEAGTSAAATATARLCDPDVVIMDVRLPDGSGIDACRTILTAQPDAHVLMLTSYADEDAAVASIMAGAAGYLLKQTEPRRLVEAVDMVARGGSLLDAAISAAVLARLRRGAGAMGDPVSTLSEHERNILPLIAEGKTNAQIAANLCLSEYTVKSYVSKLLHKLHLTRRSEAAALIARHQRQIDS